MDLVEVIEKAGLSEKAAKVYLASLELGESTLLEIGKRSKLKRTTLYYLLDELMGSGALLMTRRGKKTYFVAAEPKALLKRSRERLGEFEDALSSLEARSHAVYAKPRTYFLYGPAGFKQLWSLIFKNADDEYLITTNAEHFLEYVAEKYVEGDIVATKRKLGIVSRQLIVDSPYARKICAKDARENRSSKLISSRYPLPFTEVVAGDLVAFISPRSHNLIMVIENDMFAKTRSSFFNALWDALPS
jgi:HTH-type transcriptional regulator, sugar sensing transcriptional regulator